jgi:poly(3-hydroxybutyrate) depolymerase
MKKRIFRWRLVGMVALLAATAVAKAKPQKIEITSAGKPRTYYLLVPEKVKGPAPFIMLLHGSGRDGMSQMDAWQGLAEQEGIILAAPDSGGPEGWLLPRDGPEFLHDVAEAVRARAPVDPKRMYLFGHSAGATFSLYMGLLESQYFAAVAAHAGAVRDQDDRYMDHAARKLPVAIWVGTEDQFFSLDRVRATRDALNAHGFNAQLTEIKGHDHNYYVMADKINKQVWEFLGANSLPAEPKWETYPTAQ